MFDTRHVLAQSRRGQWAAHGRYISRDSATKELSQGSGLFR